MVHLDLISDGFLRLIQLWQRSVTGIIGLARANSCQNWQNFVDGWFSFTSACPADVALDIG